jgi:hypothetical protein
MADIQQIIDSEKRPLIASEFLPSVSEEQR